MRQLIRKSPSRLAGFWRDRRGVSAVEFALLAPVLLLFYFGMAELTEAMMAQRRLNHVTSAVGDIVARDPVLTNAERNDVFAIGATLMAPFPSNTLTLCLVSITSNAQGRDTVAWVEPYQSPPDCPKAGDVLDIPVSVLPAGQSVIMSKATYTYTTPVKYVSKDATTFRRTFYLRPRVSDAVTRTP
ncbi:MAG: pilus assembly protein [Caulobacter sp.]|nr:pilus assembly protein [Caulobacter sp.]